MWIKFSELDTKSRDNLANGKFAFIDSKGARHLPIHDANHVRAAFGRINETKDTGTGGLMSPAQKTSALAKMRTAARKFGIDAKAAMEFAEAAPKYGPGGDLDWDDDEEPDESQDDSRPGDKKSASAHVEPDDEPDDDEDDDAGVQADDGATPGPIGGPTLSDVHVPGPLNAERKKKSVALRALVQGVRAHFASGRLLASDQFENQYRKATGKAGGMAKKAAEAEDDNGDETEENEGEGSPQEGEIHSHTEGSAHHTGPDGTGYRMFLPFQFAEWVEYLPKPGVWDSDRYGKIAVTADRNNDFVKKFNDGVYQHHIPIDAEHQTKLSGAYGWIEQMRLNADGSVGAFVDWTDRGEKALAEKAFKYFSPEWYDKWKDPATGRTISNVAIGGALTTRPFFKESSLQPLVASERGFVPITDKENREMAEQEAEAKRLTELQDKADKAEAEAKKFSEELATAKQAAETAEKAVAAKEEESKKLSERIEAIERADRVRQFTEIARGFPGETATHVAILDSLSNEPISAGEGKDELPSLRQRYIETQKAAAEQIKQGQAFNALGSTQRGEAATDALQKVIQAAEAKVKADTTGTLTVAKAAAESWDDQSYLDYLAETGN